MSRELQLTLTLILIPIAFFLLWSFPGYKGLIAAIVAMAASIFFYLLSERQPTA